PAAVTIRGIELFLSETAGRVPQLRRERGNVFNQTGNGCRRDGLFEIEPADGITKIHSPDLSSGATGDHGNMDRAIRYIAIAAMWLLPASAGELKTDTAGAFNHYVQQTEETLKAPKVFLWADQSPERARRVRAGEIVVEPSNGDPSHSVKSGLIQDWVGSVFIPGVTVEKTLALVQDYSRQKEYYQPEVVDSRILSHEGNNFKIYLRLLKKKVITVQLNTEHDVQYIQLGPKRWRSVSRSTRIAEVDHPGKPSEREKPPGTGEGFLWRLNSYWRFEGRDGRASEECDAASLNR